MIGVGETRGAAVGVGIYLGSGVDRGVAGRFDVTTTRDGVDDGRAVVC